MGVEVVVGGERSAALGRLRLVPAALCVWFRREHGHYRGQNRWISGRGSRTMRLRLMVIGGVGHNVYPGLGPLFGGNTLLPA